MPTLSSELLRIDPLTECRNFLGFLETCLNISISETPRDIYTDEVIVNTLIDHNRFPAILFVDLNDLSTINATQGHAFGDSVIHWTAIVLMEESGGTVFRLGGDEFAVLLHPGPTETYTRTMERIHERMDREAKAQGFPSSPADLALVLYGQSPTTLATLMLQMSEAMERVKASEETHAMVFHASDFPIAAQLTPHWKDKSTQVPRLVRWLAYKFIFQVLDMSRNLDRILEEAYTDAISNLPNMKAALINLDKALQDSKSSGKCFSLLLIDGDDLRAYNAINYAAGDAMIRSMGSVFKSSLRPDDFVARWRSGDEFVVLLPDTPAEGAKIIGERFRQALREASTAWKYPVTISIGVACCPEHAGTIDALIDKAEAANKRAKDLGKDQVVVVGDEPGDKKP